MVYCPEAEWGDYGCPYVNDDGTCSLSDPYEECYSFLDDEEVDE